MSNLTKLQKYQIKEMIEHITPAIISEIRHHHFTKNQILVFCLTTLITLSGSVIAALIKFPKLRELFS